MERKTFYVVWKRYKIEEITHSPRYYNCCRYVSYQLLKNRSKSGSKAWNAKDKHWKHLFIHSY